jgi:hypothetical protein
MKSVENCEEKVLFFGTTSAPGGVSRESTKLVWMFAAKEKSMEGGEIVMIKCLSRLAFDPPILLNKLFCAR